MKHILTTVLEWIKIWWWETRRHPDLGWTFRYFRECVKFLPTVIRSGLVSK